MFGNSDYTHVCIRRRDLGVNDKICDTFGYDMDNEYLLLEQGWLNFVFLWFMNESLIYILNYEDYQDICSLEPNLTTRWELSLWFVHLWLQRSLMNMKVGNNDLISAESNCEVNNVK